MYEVDRIEEAIHEYLAQVDAAVTRLSPDDQAFVRVEVDRDVRRALDQCASDESTLDDLKAILSRLGPPAAHARDILLTRSLARDFGPPPGSFWRSRSLGTALFPFVLLAPLAYAALWCLPDAELTTALERFLAHVIFPFLAVAPFACAVLVVIGMRRRHYLSGSPAAASSFPAMILHYLVLLCGAVVYVLVVVVSEDLYRGWHTLEIVAAVATALDVYALAALWKWATRPLAGP